MRGFKALSKETLRINAWRFRLKCNSCAAAVVWIERTEGVAGLLFQASEDRLEKFNEQTLDDHLKRHVMKAFPEKTRLSIVDGACRFLEQEMERRDRPKEHWKSVKLDRYSMVAVTRTPITEALMHSFDQVTKNGQSNNFASAEDLHSAAAQYGVRIFGRQTEPVLASKFGPSEPFEDARSVINWLAKRFNLSPPLDISPGVAPVPIEVPLLEFNPPENLWVLKFIRWKAADESRGAPSDFNGTRANGQEVSQEIWGRRQKSPFDVGKLKTSIDAALRGRLFADDKRDQVLGWVYGSLHGMTVVTSSQISASVSEALRMVDPVAYLRWAAISREMTPYELMNEAIALIAHPPPKVQMTNFVRSTSEVRFRNR